MNRMKKGIAALLLVCLMLAAVTPYASAETIVASGRCNEDILWTLTSDGLLNITGSGEMPNYREDFPAPWYKIRSTIQYVEIALGIVSIGDYSFFDCQLLKGINIPNSVISIGNYSFESCCSLSSLTLPNGLQSVGERAFYYCEKAFHSLVLPNTLRTIGRFAFMFCNELESVTIPETITIIPWGAFGCCRALQCVTLPRSLKIIGDSAFNSCSLAAGINLPEGLQSIGGAAFGACDFSEIVIPNSVTEIGDCAFAACPKLTSVSLPSGLAEIDERTFAECSSLKSIIIPATVKRIKEAAFTECFSLTAVCFLGDAPEMDGGVFFYQDNKWVPVTLYYIPERAGWANLHWTLKSYNVATWDGKNIPTGNTQAQFRDIPSGAYYANAVSWAVAKNITKGTAADTFAPNDTCTRGQIVTFLWRAAGEPTPSGTETPFTDVKQSDYWYNAVLWAVEQGITAGTSATTFSPNEGCTRGQVATFLWRYENKPAPAAKNPFEDIKKGAYYYDAVLWAVEADVTKGTSATMFAPNDTCTRGQIVTFLYRDIA